MYDDKSVASGAAPIEHTPKETYFRDVHLFLEHARDVGSIKNKELVRTNLWTCLKGPALEWWLTELFENDKRLAKLGNKLDEWERMLIERFKAPTNVVIEVLLKERYTLRDSSNQREPQEYTQRILRAAKDAKFTNVRNQLDVIYNGLDAKLRQDFRRPKDSTKLQDFLSELDDFKHNWWTYTKRHGERNLGSGNTPSGSAPNRQSRPENRGNQGQSQSRQQQGPGFDQQPFFGWLPYQPYYSPSPRQYNGNAYFNPQQPYGQGQGGQFSGYQQPRQDLPPPRQPLQITAPLNRSGLNPPMNRPQGNGFPKRDNRGNQGFSGLQKPWQQQRLKALAYQASVKENNKEGYGQREELEPSQEENTETEASYFAGEDNQGNEMYHSTSDYPPSATKDRFAGFVGIETYCHHCNEAFPSKTKLHKHLRAGCDKVGKSLPHLANLTETETLDSPTTKIIKSNASNQETGNGFAFRSWTYAMIPVALDPSQKEDEVCVDSGTEVSLVDRAWALSKTSVPVSKMVAPLRVHGVGSSTHETSKYILHEIYFSDTDESNKRVLACVRRELHLVDDLRAKMLIENDIIGPESIVIDVANKKAYIASCGVTVRVSARPRGEFVKRRVHLNTATIVPPHSKVMLQTRSVNLPADRDFFFDPVAQTNLTLFAHLVDHTMTGVLAKNTTKLPIQVPKKLRLGDVFELEYKNCFQASVEPDFAMTHPKRVPPVVEAPLALSMPTFPNTATQTGKQETCLPNGVMIYGDTQETQSLSNLVADFLQIWEDTGFVKVPEEEWMKIPLKDDWQS